MKALFFVGLAMVGQVAMGQTTARRDFLHPKMPEPKPSFSANQYSVSYRFPMTAAPDPAAKPAPPAPVPPYHGPVMVITGPRTNGNLATGFGFPWMDGLPGDTYMQNKYGGDFDETFKQWQQDTTPRR